MWIFEGGRVCGIGVRVRVGYMGDFDGCFFVGFCVDYGLQNRDFEFVFLERLCRWGFVFFFDQLYFTLNKRDVVQVYLSGSWGLFGGRRRFFGFFLIFEGRYVYLIDFKVSFSWVGGG